MAQTKVLEIYPSGWERHPEEEKFKLSTLDYLSTITWVRVGVFFELPKNTDKSKIEEVLRKGLERTLGQIRTYAGRLEKDGHGGHSIVKRRDSTVKFVIQDLDYPGFAPTFADISRAQFTIASLGDDSLLSNAEMLPSNRPESHPDKNPVMSSFKANFIPGGLILIVHYHHFVNGLSGSSSFLHQLGDNCFAVARGTEPPYFDPRGLDRSLFGSLGFSSPPTPSTNSSTVLSSSQVKAPPRAEARKIEKQLVSTIFHLPKSKAAALKASVSPPRGTIISTYNVMCALMWRVFCQIRKPVYNPEPDFKPLFGQGVSIANQFSGGKPMPDRIQGNMAFDITSATSPVPPPTLADVVSDMPLVQLASYIRQLSGSLTVDMLNATMEKFANISNKAELSIRVDSFPIMAQYITDWRSAEVCTYDYGFAKPVAYRALFDWIPQSHAAVYPPRTGGYDEGIELQVTFEKELLPQLIQHPEWSKYFEFRGIDMDEEPSLTIAKSKL